MRALRGKGGEGVAEVLYGEIGKRVDLYRRRKRRHRDRSEAVHQPLDEQDAEVHNGLLNRG